MIIFIWTSSGSRGRARLPSATSSSRPSRSSWSRRPSPPRWCRSSLRVTQRDHEPADEDDDLQWERPHYAKPAGAAGEADEAVFGGVERPQPHPRLQRRIRYPSASQLHTLWTVQFVDNSVKLQALTVKMNAGQPVHCWYLNTNYHRTSSTKGIVLFGGTIALFGVRLVRGDGVSRWARRGSRWTVLRGFCRLRSGWLVRRYGGLGSALWARFSSFSWCWWSLFGLGWLRGPRRSPYGRILCFCTSFL